MFQFTHQNIFQCYLHSVSKDSIQVWTYLKKCLIMFFFFQSFYTNLVLSFIMMELRNQYVMCEKQTDPEGLRLFVGPSYTHIVSPFNKI